MKSVGFGLGKQLVLHMADFTIVAVPFRDIVQKLLMSGGNLQKITIEGN